MLGGSSLVVRDGAVVLPEQDGLGIEPDLERAAAYLTSHQILNA
jgi:L-alanine-DL-glutamate epimerase-like enolase superfamily enzyme